MATRSRSPIPTVPRSTARRTARQASSTRPCSRRPAPTACVRTSATARPARSPRSSSTSSTRRGRSPPAAAVTLTIGTPGQNAIYTFSGTNGQRISLSLSRTGLPTGYFLSIKNPDGSYLYGPSGGTPSFVDVTPLTQTGTFTVLVDAGNADTGTVTAQLYDVPADASGTLVIGGSGVTLQVTTPGQNAVYSFDGVTGDALTVTLSSTLSQGYFLSVKNPDGTYLYGPQGGTPSSASFTLTQTGTHLILVDAAGPGT